MFSFALVLFAQHIQGEMTTSKTLSTDTFAPPFALLRQRQSVNAWTNKRLRRTRKNIIMICFVTFYHSTRSPSSLATTSDIFSFAEAY